MKKTSVQGTPLVRLQNISNDLGIDLYVKRDDLFPETGGGNKARKLIRIIEDAKITGCNALVTNGGAQSNHARATAILAAQLGWECHVVLHGNDDAMIKPTGNLLLMKLLGTRVSIVSPEHIGDTLQLTLTQLRSEGFIPYVIPGGGHCVSGSMAYLDASKELIKQCHDLDWQPDFIIHASGTGTTQAGLIAGMELEGMQTRVIGISVARRNPRGSSVVVKALRELYTHIGRPINIDHVEFRDEWVGGGYEHASQKVIDVVKYAAQRSGLILDPTYTGKAFAALIDLVNNGSVPRGSKVVFWHTGGLLNLMASAHLWSSKGEQAD